MNERDYAIRFFWGWLIAATAASILGNVTHALLSASESGASPSIAAAVALVPPIVLLGATHGVHALVRSRIVGASYWAALAITVALACCAFVLSFEALRDLATAYAGMRPAVAWLWPLAIDLSITGSTIALLALSGAQRVDLLDEITEEPTEVEEEHRDHVHVAVPLSDVFGSAQVYGVVTETEPAAMTATLELVTTADTGATEEWTQAAADVEVRHVEAAARIVEAGVTRVEPLRVARVLAEYTAGTAPSTIARKLRMGYETVACILDHYAEQIEVKV